MDKSIETSDGLVQRQVTRREFLKFCTAVAGAIGLGPAFGTKIAQALTASDRPPILWLHFAECTGCTEAILRTSLPGFDELIMDYASLDYHETLMAAAGQTVEDTLHAAADAYDGQFFCVVEGAIPTAQNGIYGMVGGKTMLSIAEEICPKAKAIVACGTCASYGGLPAAFPNPTGAQGLKKALPFLAVPIVNVPGCPPNPINIVGTIANHLLFDQLPALDAKGRPLFAYGSKVHDQCPYREHPREYRCLEDQGCKGKRCSNNCPDMQFNDGSNFPMQAGHPCIGCSEPNFWDTMTPFYQEHVGHGKGYDDHDDEQDDALYEN